MRNNWQTASGDQRLPNKLPAKPHVSKGPLPPPSRTFIGPGLCWAKRSRRGWGPHLKNNKCPREKRARPLGAEGSLVQGAAIVT